MAVYWNLSLELAPGRGGGHFVGLGACPERGGTKSWDPLGHFLDRSCFFFFSQQQQLGSIVWISLWWRAWSFSSGAVHQFALGSEEVSWAGCLALRECTGEQAVCALRHRGAVHWRGRNPCNLDRGQHLCFKRGAAVMGLGFREGKKHSRWKQARASGRKWPLKGQRAQTSCR